LFACTAASSVDKMFRFQLGELRVTDSRIDRDKMDVDQHHPLTNINQISKGNQVKEVSIAEFGGIKDTQFAFQRALSRLIEMQSEDYYKKHKAMRVSKH